MAASCIVGDYSRLDSRPLALSLIPLVCATEVLLYGIAHRPPVADPGAQCCRANGFVGHLGGCYMCRWFGARVSGRQCGAPIPARGAFAHRRTLALRSGSSSPAPKASDKSAAPETCPRSTAAARPKADVTCPTPIQTLQLRIRMNVSKFCTQVKRLSRSLLCTA